MRFGRILEAFDFFVLDRVYQPIADRFTTERVDCITLARCSQAVVVIASAFHVPRPLEDHPWLIGLVIGSAIWHCLMRIVYNSKIRSGRANPNRWDGWFRSVRLFCMVVLMLDVVQMSVDQTPALVLNVIITLGCASVWYFLSVQPPPPRRYRRVAVLRWVPATLSGI